MNNSLQTIAPELTGNALPQVLLHTDPLPSRMDSPVLDRDNLRKRLRPASSNPIIPAPSADPWMVYHEGFYYYSESRNQNSIFIRKAREIADIGKDDGVEVWIPPSEGENSKAIWAPELHFLNGRWYIYYAADDGLNENHRMWVLESETADPLGAYRCRGRIVHDQWAIDGTVLEQDGNLYFIWSGWPGANNGRQNLYIAPMKDPVTLAGPRVLLTEPEMDWECVDMPICEGPQILKRNGKIFLVYSASGSWTVDYCLGMLVFEGGDVLDPASWRKVGPVFQKNHEVWGVGHCSFVKSSDGTEDWIVYHAKSRRKKGWNDRNIHAQIFTWTDEGFPHFGTPLLRPSRTSAPTRPRVEGTDHSPLLNMA